MTPATFAGYVDAGETTRKNVSGIIEGRALSYIHRRVQFSWGITLSPHGCKKPHKHNDFPGQQSIDPHIYLFPLSLNSDLKLPGFLDPKSFSEEQFYSDKNP